MAHHVAQRFEHVHTLLEALIGSASLHSLTSPDTRQTQTYPMLRTPGSSGHSSLGGAGPSCVQLSSFLQGACVQPVKPSAGNDKVISAAAQLQALCLSMPEP